MDPSFYLQASQNPALSQKPPQNTVQPVQNLKPGFSYPENEFFQYNPISKQIDSQRELNRNNIAFNYSQDQSNPTEPSQNHIISHRNPQTSIVDVWKHNLEEEFSKIMDLIEEYPLIALVSLFGFY